MLEWHAVVTSDIVGRGLNGGRATDRTCLRLLSASGSEVVGHDWGLATVTIEGVVLGTIDILVVLDGFDVLDAGNASIKESAIDLLVVVGGRIRGHDRSRDSLLSGSS